jgi:peptidoglycan/LPS O-acetylase OafA/YrhL
MTTVKLAAVVAVPAIAVRTRTDWFYVVGSYLFLPVRDLRGDFFPVLPVGWTLTYEMLFYGLVALSLAWRRPVIAVAGPVLGALGLAGVYDDFDGLLNTIVFEFLFGVLIGAALMQGRRIPRSAAMWLIGLGFAYILTGPLVNGELRPISWGIPAACIVSGAVALEERLAPIIPRWLSNAGDASYSIYLMHLFVIPVVYSFVARSLPEAIWLPATIVAGLLASAAVGRLGFIGIEKPLLRWMRRPSPVVAIAQ